MTTRLKLYNGALEVVGERAIASLTEAREPRRLLDNVWDDGLIRYALEQGLWNFAMRSVQATYDPDVTPEFGYRYAFSKPTDWVRTAAVCSDEYFECPVTRCSDEQGYWYADLDTLYIRYVSDDSEYGSDLSLWPETFTRWVEHYMGQRICKRLTNSKADYDTIKKDAKKLLTDARSKDAMNDSAQFPPPGTWSRARTGGGSWRRDRIGSSLIG